MNNMNKNVSLKDKMGEKSLKCSEKVEICN